MSEYVRRLAAERNSEDRMFILSSFQLRPWASGWWSGLALALTFAGGAQIFEDVVATDVFFAAATLEHQAGEKSGREVHGRCPWVMGLPPVDGAASMSAAVNGV